MLEMFGENLRSVPTDSRCHHLIRFCVRTGRRSPWTVGFRRRRTVRQQFVHPALLDLPAQHDRRRTNRLVGAAAHRSALRNIDDQKQHPYRRQPTPNPATGQNQFAPQGGGTAKQPGHEASGLAVGFGVWVVQFAHQGLTNGVESGSGGAMLCQQKFARCFHRFTR